MKIYKVTHFYEDDGGYGDAVGQEEVLALCSSMKDAKYIQKKLSNPHIYDRPYDNLICGQINIEEMEIVNDVNKFIKETKKHAWWL